MNQLVHIRTVIVSSKSVSEDMLLMLQREPFLNYRLQREEAWYVLDVDVPSSEEGKRAFLPWLQEYVKRNGYPPTMSRKPWTIDECPHANAFQLSPRSQIMHDGYDTDWYDISNAGISLTYLPFFKIITQDSVFPISFTIGHPFLILKRSAMEVTRIWNSIFNCIPCVHTRDQRKHVLDVLATRETTGGKRPVALMRPYSFWMSKVETSMFNQWLLIPKSAVSIRNTAFGTTPIFSDVVCGDGLEDRVGYDIVGHIVGDVRQIEVAGIALSAEGFGMRYLDGSVDRAILCSRDVVLKLLSLYTRRDTRYLELFPIENSVS
jgi:hypothetical protein